MTPMDEFAKEKIAQMSPGYKKAMLGHDLTEGRWDLFIANFEGGTTSTNRLRYTFTIQRTEPDENDIIRWSDVSFMIDTELWLKHAFLLERWEQFQRGLGLEPAELGLGDHEEVFQGLCFKVFRGDVSVRTDKDNRIRIDVTPLSLTGDTIDPKDIKSESPPF
jgi:hypothetical protein